MKKLIILLYSFLSLCLSTQVLLAQGLEDLVSRYQGENGRGFMQPLGDAFGASLNSGLFQSGYVKRNGFSIKVSLHVVVALISDDQKTFTATTEEPFAPAQSAEASTIFGSGLGSDVSGTGGTIYSFSPGLDVDRAPLAVTQVTIGAIMGTEVIIRFLQADLGDNFKELKLKGFGVRHSLSQYLTSFPLELSAMYFSQTFDVGDIVKADATFYGIQASSKPGPMVIYGGVGMQSSTMDLVYDFTGGETEEISFHLESENSVKFTAGLALHLSLLFIHGEYNFSDQNTISVGIGLSL